MNNSLKAYDALIKLAGIASMAEKLLTSPVNLLGSVIGKSLPGLGKLPFKKIVGYGVPLAGAGIVGSYLYNRHTPPSKLERALKVSDNFINKTRKPYVNPYEQKQMFSRYIK